MTREKTVAIWFRNDLRVHDNPCLAHAVQLIKSKQASHVLPVFFWDPRFFNAKLGEGEYACDKTGSFRKRFIIESLTELRSNLQRIGSNLLICEGRPELILSTILAPGSTVLTQREDTSEEIDVDDAVVRAGFNLQKIWGYSLFHLDDLPFNVNTFGVSNTSYIEILEISGTKVRPLLPTPLQGELPTEAANHSIIDAYCNHNISIKDDEGRQDPRSSMIFKGGEAAAMDRLHYYLDTNMVDKYKKTRSRLFGRDNSTKLAPWIAYGCISPRLIYHHIKKHEARRGITSGTTHLIVELQWRDCFRLYAMREGKKIFWPNGPVPRKTAVWKDNPKALHAWRNGTTGFPLIDAFMRELNHTGFMSNRGRMIVASFLVHQLQIDWRLGAEWFESKLVDYDIAINWVNWLVQAGLAGGSKLHMFNPIKQGAEFDPDGLFVKHWCPELSSVPAEFIHEVWKWPNNSKLNYPQKIPVASKALDQGKRPIGTVLPQQKNKITNYFLKPAKVRRVN